ncbi:hypothetical protein [Rhizobium sp. BT03]|uniref:hypothetical protein n=1 Tax=Rhizobium sp. BT03 TaxID=3045156 RepID=UPI0024B3DA36|nr:hypothetical protein [Rhizobium sp. BT03]WHO73905.1 hypothetical protein QMO80_002957 [Rhizobium sp. BT03]
MSTLVPIFLQYGTLSPPDGFRQFHASLPHRFVDPRLRIFLSGIIQKTGPFAAVDVKAKGKH